MTPQQNKHTGNALVFSLLIVLTTAIIAYALIEASTFAVRRTQHFNVTDACAQILHAGEAFAIDLLKQENVENIGSTTDLSQLWAQPFHLNLSKEMHLKAELTDQQARYNVNALTESVASPIYNPAAVYKRLLTTVHIPNASALEHALSYWVNSERNDGDKIYSERNPPYRAAHMLLVSISELNLIDEYSKSVIDSLSPYVTALPSGSRINVNTASAELLAALLDAPVNLLHTLINERADYAFTDTQMFMDRARSRGINVKEPTDLEPLIDVNSEYFLLKTDATCQKTAVVSYSWIKRISSDKAYVYQRTPTL